jgi:hypothetical protein
MGSLTEASLEAYTSVGDLLTGSLTGEDAPTAPVSVKDLVGEATGSLVELTGDTTGSAALLPEPTFPGSSVPVTGSLGQFLTRPVTGSVIQESILGSLMEAGCGRLHDGHPRRCRVARRCSDGLSG